MVINGINKTIFWSFVSVILTTVLPAAAGDFDLTEWERKWTDFETRDDLSDTERLSLQTEILEVVGPFVAWRDPTVWEWSVDLLRRWEASPEIEKARISYYSILNQIGLAGLESDDPLPDEQALREFYQRALSVVRSPEKEGNLLFHLAESLVRSEPDTDENHRRIEAFFQQAILSMLNEPPKDLIHLSLAGLYARWGSTGGDSGSSNEPLMSRAAFHYKAVLEMEAARASLKEQAQSALEALLKPEVEWSLMNRFLPRNDVLISASSRNVPQIQIEIYALPWMADSGGGSLDQLRTTYAGAVFSPEERIFSKTFPVVQPNRLDWQKHDFRLGESFSSGWYWVRLSGDGFVLEDLMLVTPLEGVMIPRPSGAMTLWVADVESGMPVPNAIFRVLDEEGQVITTALSDLKGMATVDHLDLADWQEIHVQDGINPGVIRRADVLPQGIPTPWIVPHAVQVNPGMRLEWTLVASDDSVLEAYGKGMRVHLPDGAIILPQIDTVEAGFLQAGISIPASTSSSGPVFLELPDHRKVFLSHLLEPEFFPLAVELSGDSYSAQENLFLNTSPVGVRIYNLSESGESLPEYIRVKVSALSRQFVYDSGQSTSDELREVSDTIFSLVGSGTVSAFFELPIMDSLEEVQPLKIEVFPLSGDELLGCRYLALVPFRSRVNLTVQEHILHGGDTIDVSLSVPDPGESLSRTPAGDLIVYRETWESRYIHRSRGAQISEEDYLRLPDRSLLGSAKTDYRLFEQGFIREEVRRIRVDLVENMVVPIQLERSGYYRIEFDGRDLDVRPQYPDGPLEVWVIPDSGDLRAFRSENRRLIVDKSSAGPDQILILLDDVEASVLLDQEFEDGSISTVVLKPESAAVLFEKDSAGGAELAHCRAVVMGQRRTDFLYQTLSEGEDLQWTLENKSSSGLNPGTAFSWSFTREKGRLSGPVLWGFHPVAAQAIIDNHLLAQARMQLRELNEIQQDIVSLGDWLPLYHPLGLPQPAQGLKAGDRSHLGNEGSAAIALYPELCQEKLLEGTSFSIAKAEDSMEIKGFLPDSVGQWRFTLLSPSEHNRVSWMSWPVSTELPIRTSLKGPLLLRPGDQAVIPLVVENTTLDQEALRVDLETAGTLNLTSPARMENVFVPGQKVEFPVAFESVNPGTGTLTARTFGDDSSEAFIKVTTASPEPSPGLRLYRIDASSVPWQQEVDLTVWDSGKVIVSAAVGNLLPAIWEAIQDDLANAEPLLARLGEWALGNAQYHHGIIDSRNMELEQSLLAQLEKLQTDTGGWAWTPGHPADPWLTALILWSLETFFISETERLSPMRASARDLLELVLVRNEETPDSRLLALRALSVSALKDKDVRPSRIQAKTFLEFLHNRDRLNNAELAILLQVARGYDFSDEVRLLMDELSQRLRSPSRLSGRSFWADSLVYVALGGGSKEKGIRQSVLGTAFKQVNLTGSLRGWKETGAFLNLLSAFFWEGDFEVEGNVVVTVGEADPVRVPLNPLSEGNGVLIREVTPSMLEKGEVTLKVASMEESGSVYVILSGNLSNPVDPPDFAEQSEQSYREYYERTLLTGSRLQVKPVDPESALQPGDTLQVHLSVYVEESQPFAEFQFSIPAGGSLESDAVQHALVPFSSEAIFTQPIITQVEQDNPLRQVIRMEPLVSGRHEFILSYRINWTGDFAFPAHRMILPMTGDTFRIGSSRRLTVVPVTGE